MLKTDKTVRIAELRAMLAAYRHLTIQEVEDGDWGDIQIELEAELWRLEQDPYGQMPRGRVAA